MEDGQFKRTFNPGVQAPLKPSGFKQQPRTSCAQLIASGASLRASSQTASFCK